MQSLAFKFIANGIFGYISHEAVEYFDSIEINKKKSGFNIPEIYYAVYQNIIAISLFNHEAYLFSNIFTGSHNLEEIEVLLNSKKIAYLNFKK